MQHVFSMPKSVPTHNTTERIEIRYRYQINFPTFPKQSSLHITLQQRTSFFAEADRLCIYNYILLMIDDYLSQIAPNHTILRHNTQPLKLFMVVIIINTDALCLITRQVFVVLRDSLAQLADIPWQGLPSSSAREAPDPATAQQEQEIRRAPKHFPFQGFNVNVRGADTTRML